MNNNKYCLICNKKLKITAIKCKCNNFFCKYYKNENIHNCIFDYKKFNKDLLEKNMPIVISEKIKKIN